MVDAKVEHLWSEGIVFDARVFAGLKHWFMRGLPTTGKSATEEGGLDAAIKMFRWRGDEEEAEETRRSGVNLLFWSVLANNLGAVCALATKDAPFPGGRVR